MVLKESDDVRTSPSADELTMGIHYVRSLGGDHPGVRTDPSTHTVSTHVRSSFSSLESSHDGHTASGGVARTLVRAGEKFKFRVDVSLYSAASYTKARKLEARLISGKPLPKFLHVDLNGSKHSGAVEFYGAPAARDLGEFNVGVYAVDDGTCVGRAVVEVVGASR
jgi:axial budding pattern protein 2